MKQLNSLISNICDMKNIRYTLLLSSLLSFGIAILLSSCEKVDEEPKINKGYETKYRKPDAEYLSDEDRQVISDQEDEYENNTPK